MRPEYFAPPLAALLDDSDAGFEASENVIIGNTCLYGATGGALFVNGRAGERFAVRNSMADTVVEVNIYTSIYSSLPLYI